jgi:undecaprenyl diphosphate synthase
VRDRIEDVKAGGLPTHVAIIMDGNGRWAKQRRLSRAEGHIEGAKAVERLIRFAAQDLELEYLTLFAFSAENWDRPKAEVDALMALLRQFALDRMEEFRDAGIRLRILGDLDAISAETRDAVRHVVDATQYGTGLNLTIALNYGSQQELIRACRRIAHAVCDGALASEAIDRTVVAANLYAPELPDPDLIIRTSGEQRLSNFLLWQSAYAELAFPETLWPDFSPDELLDILEDYQSRDRRFGKVEGG